PGPPAGSCQGRVNPCRHCPFSPSRDVGTYRRSKFLPVISSRMSILFVVPCFRSLGRVLVIRPRMFQAAEAGMKDPHNHDSQLGPAPTALRRHGKLAKLSQTVLLCAVSFSGVRQGWADEEPPPARQQAEAVTPSKAQMKAGQTFFLRGQQLFREGKYEAAW